MKVITRRFPELTGLSPFTGSLRGRLERALVHALRGRNTSGTLLQAAVIEACAELRAAGANDESVLGTLGGLVEDFGRACGADRPSLMSGEPRWMPVRERVLAQARLALANPVGVRAVG